jgi:hypothetical protein
MLRLLGKGDNYIKKQGHETVFIQIYISPTGTQLRRLKRRGLSGKQVSINPTFLLHFHPQANMVFLPSSIT